MTQPSSPEQSGPASFPTTRWSMVLRAGSGEADGARSALASLCRDYWYPLYAYARRRGHSPTDAQDLVQSFIVHMLSGPLLSRADPERGRFRSFMLGSLQNFLAKEHRRQRADKRGGRAEIVSLDEARDEGRFAAEPAEVRTPETLFERSWALALLERVLHRARAEYEAAGRLALFETLQPFLPGKQGRAGYAALVPELGLSENMVAVSVHRLRRRYGELLREEIAHTVASAAEIEEEIAHLRAVLAA